MKLALFDFDGTITRRDSFIHFIIFATGFRRFLAGLFMLSPLLIIYKCNIISNAKAKENVLNFFFRGWSVDRFRKAAYSYSREKLSLITNKTAMDRINWHKQEGHKVVVVSASFESLLKDWCSEQNIDLIGTKIEIKNGKITGRFLSTNCYGIEKVKRIKESINLPDFEYIYAYGDSKGDREMLELADEVYYGFF
jgi:phosphatidylglycerophosphatase C